MSNLYRFYWLDGTISVWEADSPKSAITNAGYGQGALAALDFYTENGSADEYKWINGEWVLSRTGKSVPKSRGLTGIDLLNALGLDKAYPHDSRFSDITTQYGIAGCVERLVGQCTSDVYNTTEYGEDDEWKDSIEFNAQVTKVLVEAIEKLKKIKIPENVKDDALYSDGRL